VFGRNSEVREQTFREGLGDCDVDVKVEGVVDGDVLVERLSASDALLFLRGTISSRRGSAIAGIACGLPVIGLQGSETDAPVTDAGVVLLENDSDGAKLGSQAGETLARIFSDETYRKELVSRSKKAQQKSFSWKAIARRYAELLHEKQRPSFDCEKNSYQ